MRRCTVGAAICVLLMLTWASAADAPKEISPSRTESASADPQLKLRPSAGLSAPALDQQTVAETLIERARHLSDIREPDAPPFRLKATFSFVGDELETFEGSYTEYWMSDSRWRREIVIGDRKKIEIANDRKIWETESGPMLPEKASRVEFATGIFPARSAQLDFESVESAPDRQGTKCAVTKPNRSNKGRSALCFDQSTGVLLEYVIPQWARYHLTDFACSYGEFKQFGGRWFPFEITCRQGGHRQMEVHVSELAGKDFIDARLFDPPATGAIELGHCSAGEIDAKPDYTPAPFQPAGMRDHVPSVTLRMVVDAKGKPEDIQVVRPVDKSLDETAVGTVGRWHFKPATCNGEPMAQRVEFEVAFRSY